MKKINRINEFKWKHTNYYSLWDVDILKKVLFKMEEDNKIRLEMMKKFDRTFRNEI